MDELKAGAAATNITPHLGTVLAGSLTARIAEDVHDELYAKAVVLDDGTARLALVVCDLICAPRAYLDRAKERVEQACGIPRSNVMVSCTHTHTGPAPSDLLDVEQEQEYMEFATGKIADSVSLAARRLRPCEIGFETGYEDRLVFNRRYWTKDGSVRTNPGYGNADVVRPAGPVDPEVGVLCVREPEGRTIALLANYALHYVGGGSGTAVSADYFGFFAEAIQRMKGETFTALLANGACGDINNIDIHHRPAKQEPYAHARSVAAMLAAEVVKVWERMTFSSSCTLAAAMEEVTVGVRRPSPEELAAAEELLQAPEKATDRDRVYAQDAVKISRMPTTMDTWVQVLRVGELGVVALPGEMFVEIGLAVKEKSPFEPTFVIELANDYAGYVGTRNAYDEGGYETQLALSSRVTPEAGEKMMDAALRLLEMTRRRGDAETR